MLAGYPDKSVQTRTCIVSQARRLLMKAMALMALMGLMLGSNRGFGGEISAAEYRIKSLFLLNFAKYVDWPANAFAAASAPIAIGLIGEDQFAAELAKTVEGKIVTGRRIVIQPIETDDDLRKCHILFIAGSDRNRQGEILAKIKVLPVLSVGETDQFLDRGGVINFVKREGKVRLEINLDASRQANLVISAKLLSVADVVKGKTN